MIKTRYAVVVALVILLLVISVRISQPVAAQTDNSCPDSPEPDANGACLCPDGSEPDANGACPNQEGSARVNVA
jgi:hypothetical protein